MIWCGENSGFSFNQNGPSECFCYSIFVLIPSIILLAYIFFSSIGFNVSSFFDSQSREQQQGQQQLLHFRRISSSNPTQIYLLWILVICCWIQPILFASFSLTENVSPAKITAVTLHFLAWLICSINIYYDFHNNNQWPCSAINIYFCISVAVCVIIVASLYSDQHISTSFILGLVLFLVSLGITILSYFKDSLFPISQTDTKYSPITFPATSESPPSFFQRLLGNKKINEDEVVSFLQPDHENGNRLSDPMAPTTSTRWSNASEDILLVKSMRETSRLSDSEANSKPKVQSKVLSRILEQPHSSRPASGINIKSRGGGVHGSLAPKGSQSRQELGTPGGFSAAARAKADNRSDIHTRDQIHHLESIKLLVEKWGLRRQGYGHEEKPHQNSDDQGSDDNYQHSERFSSIVRYEDDDSEKQSISFSSTLAPLNESEENSTNDQKPPSFDSSTNLTEHNLLLGEVSSPPSHSSSSSQSTQRGKKHQRGNQLNDSKNTILLLTPSSPSDPHGIPMEVEFEISLQVSDDVEENKIEKWTVWRTAKELLSLHAVLVAKFGDTAPRRPKLHSFFASTVSVEDQSITKPMILSDMRIIAGYLRVVLSQTTFHSAALYSFLEIPMTLLSKETLPSDPVTSRSTLNELDLKETLSGSPPETSQQMPSAVPELVRNRSTGPNENQSMETTKDKWRKIFLHLKRNLKPREISVRCRVFDGVVCGSDIVKWMIKSADSTAHDQIDACLISQGLVTAELLVPVALGYRNITDIDNEEIDPSTIPFSDEKGYIYRYPSGSARTGVFTLFGAPVTVIIPRWIQVDGDGNISTVGGTDSNGAPYTTAGLQQQQQQNRLETLPNSPNSNTAGYVQYTIDVTLGDDRWETFRSYNDFGQFHRNLQKEKIKPNANFPSTSFSQLMRGQATPVGEAKMDQRRLELESYLRSAIDSVLRTALQAKKNPSGDSPLLTMLAEFLDDNHSRLRLASTMSSDLLSSIDESTSVSTTTAENKTQSLGQISQVVGL